MTDDFKDFFSQNSEDYARYRPGYPKELINFLSSITPTKRMAWDCGTGSGQAAIMLADYFSEVIATDASASQIANAKPNEKILYEVGMAENSGILSRSVDLVTVAQAIHWFNRQRFYREVRRVTRQNAIIAIWGYQILRVSEEIDQLLDILYHNIVGDYWPPERKMIEENYLTLDFPFDEIETPPFSMQVDWKREGFIGYLNTWYSVRTYREKVGKNPLKALLQELNQYWDESETRKITWPIIIRVGHV